MPVNVQEILEAAMKLPDADRLAIANCLMETLPNEIVALGANDSEFLNELDRRWQSRHDTVPWNSLRGEWPAQ
jgi:hypothetical protein